MLLDLFLREMTVGKIFWATIFFSSKQKKALLLSAFFHGNGKSGGEKCFSPFLPPFFVPPVRLWSLGPLTFPTAAPTSLPPSPLRFPIRSLSESLSLQGGQVGDFVAQIKILGDILALWAIKFVNKNAKKALNSVFG